MGFKIFFRHRDKNVGAKSKCDKHNHQIQKTNRFRLGASRCKPCTGTIWPAKATGIQLPCFRIHKSIIEKNFLRVQYFFAQRCCAVFRVQSSKFKVQLWHNYLLLDIPRLFYPQGKKKGGDQRSWWGSSLSLPNRTKCVSNLSSWAKSKRNRLRRFLWIWVWQRQICWRVCARQTSNMPGSAFVTVGDSLSTAFDYLWGGAST